MIKANSLLYTIYVMLVIGIISAGVLLLASWHGKVNQFYQVKTDHYVAFDSMIEYVLSNQVEYTDAKLEQSSAHQLHYHGLLKVLNLVSYSANDTLKKSVLIGSRQYKNTALYLSNYAQGVSTTAQVNINGDLYLPDLYVKEIYVANSSNKFIHNGKKYLSEFLLPKINYLDKVRVDTTDLVSLRQLKPDKEGVYHNSFHQTKKRILWPDNTAISGVTIKGNFEIISNDTLLIRKNAKLTDVVLYAPKVVIEDQFQGSLQVFATDQIQVGEQVKLEYPSVVALKSTNESKGSIIIGKRSDIKGAVILLNNSFKDLSKKTMTIFDQTKIMGLVYCQGVLSLKAEVKGSVYANKMVYHTKSSSYLNCLSGFRIDLNAKPKVFVDPVIFNQSISYDEVIKTLY